MVEQTPLYRATAGAGAEFAEDRGWLLPAHFGDPLAEYARTREQASLFDVSHRGKVELRGPDATAFLHNLSSNDIRALKPGDGCEAFLATAKAKLVAHLFVFLVAEPDAEPSLWLDVAPEKSASVSKHLDHFLISEQVELADRTRDFAQVHVAGPRTLAVLNQAWNDELPDLRQLQHLERVVAGVGPCQIRRHDPLGLPGFDVLCPAAAAEAVWQTLLAAGARPAGQASYNWLRIEAGTPEDGIDMDENNSVMELGRTERAICYTKGCFLGQEPIVRSRDLGHVNWCFRGLRVSGSQPLPRGAPLWRDGKEVGRITSTAFSPRLGITVALAFVRRGSDAPGTPVEVATGDERRQAEVTSLPFPA